MIHYPSHFGAGERPSAPHRTARNPGPAAPGQAAKPSRPGSAPYLRTGAARGARAASRSPAGARRRSRRRRRPPRAAPGRPPPGCCWPSPASRRGRCCGGCWRRTAPPGPRRPWPPLRTCSGVPNPRHSPPPPLLRPPRPPHRRERREAPPPGARSARRRLPSARRSR